MLNNLFILLFNYTKILLFVSSLSLAAPLTIKVSDIKSESNNHVWLALFDSEDSYKTDKPVKTLVCKYSAISLGKCTFNGLENDNEYALAMFIDENGNGELDTNFIGYPKEDFSFSNKPTPLFGKPSFKRIKFKNKESILLEKY